MIFKLILKFSLSAKKTVRNLNLTRMCVAVESAHFSLIHDTLSNSIEFFILVLRASSLRAAWTREKIVIINSNQIFDSCSTWHCKQQHDRQRKWLSSVLPVQQEKSVSLSLETSVALCFLFLCSLLTSDLVCALCSLQPVRIVNVVNILLHFFAYSPATNCFGFWWSARRQSNSVQQSLLSWARGRDMSWYKATLEHESDDSKTFACADMMEELDSFCANDCRRLKQKLWAIFHKREENWHFLSLRPNNSN